MKFFVAQMVTGKEKKKIYVSLVYIQGQSWHTKPEPRYKPGSFVVVLFEF